MNRSTHRSPRARLSARAAAFSVWTALALLAVPGGLGAQEYRLYVANESSDLVSRVLFSPASGAEVESEFQVGMMPADVDGAHGVSISPDGESLYVTVAHGTPYGSVWKLAAGPDTVVARTPLGLFPATMGITPDSRYLLAVNFNLHGDMVPSDVSVVYAPDMMELTRVTTCLMPHGSRVSASGAKHYSVCMHSDQLVELDLETFRISHRYSLRPDHEGSLPLDDRGEMTMGSGMGAARGGMAGAGHAGHMGGMDEPCSPTWAEPGAGPGADRFVYVACNKSDVVLEIDVESWAVNRRWETGRAPYNLEITPDGRYLVATLKGAQAIAVFDLSSGTEVARLETTQPVTHGAVASPDSRYVFVTNEAVGGTPGTLDVFDLAEMTRVSSVALALQPGGIDFWRMTPAP